MDKDANKSCHNTGDVKNAGENLEQESASNNAIVEISEKINSKIVYEEERTSDSHRQQNDYFQELESCEIVENVWHSFNSFQRTISNIHKKDKLPYNASYDFTSVIDKYLISRTYDNLPDASELGSQLMEKNNKDARDTSRSLPTTESSSFGSNIRKCANCRSSSNGGIHTREMHCDIFNEDDDWDIYQPGIVTTDQSSLEPLFSFERPVFKIEKSLSKNNKDAKDTSRSLPTTESSSFGSKTIRKCANCRSSSNGGIHKREMHCDMFNEDDDWDIYQPGIVTTDQSLLEPLFSFERPVFKNEKSLSKNNSRSVDYDSCQKVSPYTARESSYPTYCNSVNSWGVFAEWHEDRILKEVKEYFLNNPVQVTNNLSDCESKKRLMSAPYFSMNFALRHGLSLPTNKFIQDLGLLEDSSNVSRLLKAFSMMINLGISEEEFFRYMFLDYHRIADTSPQKWYTYSGLDSSLIQVLDLVQEQVGPDIFHIIYEKLRARDAAVLAIFRDHELPNATTQNQADSISNVMSEDNFVSQTDANFPSSTTNQSHDIRTPSLNDSGSNSYADDGAVKTIHKVLKNNESLTDLSKVQSIKPNGISETRLKHSSILQSTSQDNKEIRSSFGSVQGYSDQSNGSVDPASIILPHVQNSDDQNGEKSSKVHSINASKNSPNKARHSDQNFKENSGDVKSVKSYEVLENVSNVQPGVRKYISQDDKSRKKIRLQENSTESKQEESPRKDESRTSSQSSWPGKPGNKSCVVM